MVAPKSSATPVEHPNHEALLTGVVALATLFSNCVEAFGLIHPSHKWDQEEQLLLARLGIQQARLLIWGDVLGITSPPKCVTDRAIPKHPSSAYPDLNEPTFFGARDARLDEPDSRSKIEKSLSAILDRPNSHHREEMMSRFGLRPPKKMTPDYEPALDTNRLEAFRERWELLQEVAESYAQINTRRTHSVLHTSWQIADCAKFTEFVKLTQTSVDHVIDLMDVKEAVDRGVRMDIRGFGWHVTPLRSRVLKDTAKLRLLQQICKQHYPEYAIATAQALEQIQREARENSIIYDPHSLHPTTASSEGSADQARSQRRKSSGLTHLFKFLGKDKDHHGHSRKDSGLAPPSGPPRSLSDAGTAAAPSSAADMGDDASLSRSRSKSVGAWIDTPYTSAPDAEVLDKLEQFDIADAGTAGTAAPVAFPGPIRHDQYHGIARTNTKDLHQADY